MEREGYIIIDIGTGNVRVAITGTNGEVLCVERDDILYEKDENYTNALYFNPDKLWSRIIVLTKNVLHQVPDVAIKAITALSQREGVVLLGPNGESLIGFPNIDHRGQKWENIVEDKSHVYRLTGRYPTSLFSAMKLVGLREVQPDLYSKVTTMVSISDWAQYQLSDIAGYEHSQASETQLYDVANKSWSAELYSVFGISENILPELHSSGTILGKILPNYAAILDISPEVDIIVGGADTQLAIKSTQPSVEDVVIVAGTTTPIVKIIEKYIIDEKERSWTNRYIDKSSFVLETNAGVTGLNYQRLKDIFYPNESYETIEEELLAIDKPDCVASLGSLVADEKTPLTRGGFVFNVPVAQQLSRACFVQATLWDIACCIKENYESLCDVDEHTLDYVWACGGGMQSRTLQQYIANLINKKVQVRHGFQQSSVVGGALICNEAFGIKNQTETSVEVIHPQEGNFDSLYKKWKNVREEFKGHLEKEIA
jgi:autoinducer 2 (AI-2) kinase